MTTAEEAIDIVKRYIHRDKNKDPDGLDEFFAPDFANHSSEGTVRGLNKLKDFVVNVREWMPDIEVSIKSIFASLGASNEPWVGVYVTLSGTVAEHNQVIEMQEVWIFRISNGKIAERWYVHDQSASVGW